MSTPTAAEWQQALELLAKLQDRVERLEDRVAKEGEVNRRLWQETLSDLDDPGDRRDFLTSMAAGHVMLPDFTAPPRRLPRPAPIDVAAAAQSLDAINARQETT